MIELNDEKLVVSIGKDFDKQNSFKYLLKKYNEYDRYELLAALTTYGYYSYELRDLFAIDSFYDEDFIVISDTHIGSYNERIDYINMVYDYAKEKGIKKILHCGDIIHSTMRGCRYDLVDQDIQVNYMMCMYPESNIDTYFLFGNHDYHTIKEKNVNMFKILSSRDNFHPLGFKKVYLNWCGYLISMSHHLDNYKLPVYEMSALFNFKGHRHALKVDNGSVSVPTLSDNIISYGNEECYPGFLLVTKNGLFANVYANEIKNDKISDKGKILTREFGKSHRTY